MSTVADCLTGKCDCPSASACKFARCKNCDYPIDAHGKTLVDHGGEEEKLQVCPDCGGPLNDRLVYGALVACDCGAATTGKWADKHSPECMSLGQPAPAMRAGGILLIVAVTTSTGKKQSWLG